MRKKFLYIISILLLLAMSPSFAFATDYYVKPDGDDTKNGLSVENAWLTLTKANTILVADDIVRIMAGVYASQRIDPINSGSDGHPITYQNYDSDKPVLTGDPGQSVYLRSGADWIIIDGVIADGATQYGFRILTSYNIIRNCEALNIDQYKGIYGHTDADYNLVENNIVDEVGHIENGGGDVGDGIQFQGEYNLIQNNHVYRVGHSGIHIGGTRNIIQGNHIENIWGRCISDQSVNDSTADELNVFQDNTLYDTRLISDFYPNTLFQGKARYAIFRRNRCYKCGGSGLHLDGTTAANPSYSKLYHNLIFDCGNLGTDQWDTGIAFTEHDDGCLSGVIVKNNLFYDNYTDGVEWRDHADSGDHTVSNNHWNSDGDPKFVDSASGDFRLMLNSPCIDAGDWLSTITSETGSGTSFVVDNAGYFCDGLGIITGDEIQLEGDADPVEITDINYGTNTITVDEGVSWTQGDGVALAYRGNAPNIGAYELVVAPLQAAQGYAKNFIATAIAVNDDTTVVDGDGSLTSVKVPIGNKDPICLLEVWFTPAAGAAVSVDFEFAISSDNGLTFSTGTGADSYIRIQVNTNVQGEALTGIVRIQRECQFHGATHVKLYRIVVGSGAGNCTAINARISL